MSFQTRWEISGTDIKTANVAFTQSARLVVNNLKRHESEFNKLFKEHLDANMMRAGMEADNFSDVFRLEIDHGSINFINTAPLVTQRYEYGYYTGSKDTNEEYYEEYMLQTSPRYFIRPAIQETLNDIGQTILNEAREEYERNH